MFKRLAALLIACSLLAMQTIPAAACGGPLGPDGPVALAQSNTLVGWHDGIEHYMTSFSYEGDISKLGWLLPLPAVPLKIEKGGTTTFETLYHETHPVHNDSSLFGAAASQKSAPAQVIQQTKIDALNITVIRGDGQEVLTWAKSNGFSVDDETRGHLLMYAHGSPIFMAAKYDLSTVKAKAKPQNGYSRSGGDVTPVLVTMKTTHPWIPLELIANDNQQVNADIYLLTDMPINTSDLKAKIGWSAVGDDIPNADGFTVAFQEKMTSELHDSLLQDAETGNSYTGYPYTNDGHRNWVRPDGWLTYLSLNAPSTTVTYDMGVSSAGVIRLASFGTVPMAVVDNARSHDLPAWLPTLPMGTPQATFIVVPLLVVAILLFLFLRRRRRAKSKNAVKTMA